MRTTYAVILIATGLALSFLRDFTSLIIFVLAILLPILTYILALYTARHMEIVFKPVDYIIVSGKPVTIKLTLNNKTRFPIGCMKFKLISQNSFVIAGTGDNAENISMQMLPRGELNLDVTVISPHCGNIRVKVTNVRIYDVFRLTYATSRFKNNTAEITNLPQRLKPDEALTISDSDTEDSIVYSEQKRGEDTSQVFDYHEYSQGDSIKNVNWKLSSRMDMLMVKEFSLPISSNTLIMVELDAHTYDDMDATISQLYWVSRWMLESGHTYTIRWIQHQDLREYDQLIDPAVDDGTVFLSVLKQIYSSVVQYENVLLHGYSNSTPYSNVIYIVHAVSAQMTDKLCEIGLHANLTVICHQYKVDKEQQSLQQELQSHGIKLIKV